MSNLKVNTINDASGGSNAVLYGVAAPANSMGFRNRIINGDMRIDQRNAGASVTIPSSAYTYTLDRWAGFATQASKFTVQQNAGSVTPPAGFTNYLGAVVGASANVTVGSSDLFIVRQAIEGFNVADLGWGAAGAQAVTLSFWVRASLTGAFGGSINTNFGSNAYPFTYTINSANTWEYKTISIAGPTTGGTSDWHTDNSSGPRINFSLGAGSTLLGTAGAWAAVDRFSATGSTNLIATNGATFYITGVQLEAGSVASPFERIDYGRQLIQCQRYYVRQGFNVGGVSSLSDSRYYFPLSFPVTMRATPTAAWVSGGNVSTGTPRGAITGQANTVGGSPSSILVGLSGPTVVADGTGAVTYNDPIFQIAAEL
jgi:hypothetical protein